MLEVKITDMALASSFAAELLEYSSNISLRSQRCQMLMLLVESRLMNVQLTGIFLMVKPM